MSRSLQSTMVFAVAQNGRVIHVDEVSNGVLCACTCPACHAPLIAKNGGEERAHHFAHDGRIEENSCSETALHFAAKQILSDNKKVQLPDSFIEMNEGNSTVMEFSEVLLEHRLEVPSDSAGHIVADCFGIQNVSRYIIEIAVHHQVDDAKIKKLQALNLPSFEINLTDFAETKWGWENLTQEVLFNVQRRKWLWQPVADTAIQDDLYNRTEWVFEIGGRWVWVKKLPYGNIKIFHRPSDYLRSIVQPLCQHKGFWNKKFNCWVVFDQFKDDILKRLSGAGRLLSHKTNE